MLKDKKIAFYVSGGIAVYKSVYLLRELIKEGTLVRVAMTEAATEFVTPLTFQILSQHEVMIDTFDENHPDRVNHIYLADWADYSIVAPATADIIGKIANGLGSDFVTSALLATDHPLFFVPAMNHKMYANPVFNKNKKELEKLQHVFMEPDTGFLAEGYEGKGRFPEISRILDEFKHFILQRQEGPLSGKRVIVTAGGTVERIDPVRYISNDSSGKMGLAMAQAAYYAGASVTLITTSQLPSTSFINSIKVESAKEMFDQVSANYDQCDYLIMAAAVSDYAPKHQADQKMKKQTELTIELQQNPDILAEMGQRKNHQINIGFAAETNDLQKYATEKLDKKNADYIIANEVGKDDRGFNVDENAATIFSKNFDPVKLPLQSKQDLADRIVETIMSRTEESQ